LCDQCDDIQPGAIPPPPGTHVYQWQSAQESIAEEDDFVIYQYEWDGESADLGPFGRRHLSTLVPRLATTPELRPINIEASGDSELDKKRRGNVIDTLTNGGVHDAELWVLVGNGVAEGLMGPEAERLEQNYLRGGSRSGNGGSSGGSGGGGGFGGGGVF
jgi:uncharacterized membrane protein YgcG